jgi:hypothetical protein
MISLRAPSWPREGSKHLLLCMYAANGARLSSGSACNKGRSSQKSVSISRESPRLRRPTLRGLRALASTNRLPQTSLLSDTSATGRWTERSNTPRLKDAGGAASLRLRLWSLVGWAERSMTASTIMSLNKTRVSILKADP